MGQASSIDHDPNLKAIVNKLSKLEIKDIEAVFIELSTKTQEGQSVIRQPTWLNRDKFAELFGTTELVVEQLFEALDRDKNGVIDLDEFVTGMALILHGNVKEKCKLLFKIFNLDGGSGISRDELSTVLTSCLQSARAVLLNTLKSQGITGYEDSLSNQTENALMVSVVVEKIVKDAFNKCDISKSDLLELDEFVHWVHKNPKLISNLFVLHCPKLSTSNERSNLSVDSQFSVIEPQPEEHLEDNVFDQISDKKTTEEPAPTNLTLLSMASTVEAKQHSLNHLFSKPDGPDQETFFDSLTAHSSTDNLSENRSETSIPRPSSQEDLSTQSFKVNIESMGGSESNITELPLNKNLHQLQPHHYEGSTASLQSIALSRDDLNIETSVASDSVSEEAPDDNPVENEDENSHDLWHPLQGKEQQDDALSNENAQNSESNLNEQNPEIETEQIVEETTISTEVQQTPVVEVQQTPVLEVQQIPVMVNQTENLNKLNSGNSTFSYWEPSSQTQQLLNGLQHGEQTDRSMMTFPTVLVEGLMGDPVRDLVTKYLGEQESSKRPTPTLEDVEISEDGLKHLLTNGCWRSAIDLTTKYLTACGQGPSSMGSNGQTLLTPSLMQIWFVRIALLVKLRMFSSAEAELNAFNDFDAPDMFYEFYPDIYPGQKGSIVPFSFRLLNAELPQHNGRPNIALDRLYELLNKTSLVIGNLTNGKTENGDEINESIEENLQERLTIWEKRSLQIHYALGNCFLRMKEYTLAVKLFEKIIIMEPNNKAAILSAIGRTYLQFGDVKTSIKYFQQVEEMAKTDQKLKSIELMDKGYTALAKGIYEDAYQNFSAVMKHDPDHLTACNNAAVSSLFLGKVKEASNILESTVMRNPSRGLHEDILFNLNTVYELETSRSLQKKHKLLDLVSKHKGDGFNALSLKLT